MTSVPPRSLTRRDALATIGGALFSLTACTLARVTETIEGEDGRLTARPGTPDIQPQIGLSSVPVTLGVSGLLFVPSTYRASSPAPAALLLHGAGQGPDELMTPLSILAEERGLVLVAIGSSDATWDLVRGAFGTDVRAIDKTLAWLFMRCAIDTSRFGVIGFSDGATYSLALGRVNGDLFRRVIAYSPGYLAPISAVGHPEIFVTHGNQDRVLPVETTRNVTVPALLSAGYVVQYREFTGGHGVTESLVAESIDWFVRKI